MTSAPDTSREPYWLRKMREAARQRPRTQFIKIRWIELQMLLRERDTLWESAGPEVRERILAQRAREDYAYLPPRERSAVEAERSTPSA